MSLNRKFVDIDVYTIINDKNFDDGLKSSFQHLFRRTQEGWKAKLLYNLCDSIEL